MTLTVDLPADLSDWLAERSRAAGTTPEAFVADQLRRNRAADAWAEACALIREEAARNGLTDDAARDLFDGDDLD